MQRRSARILLSVGAVVVATTGALVITAAATPTSGNASSLVPITPCRIADTRPGTDTIGPRATPLGAGETYTIDTWGTNGNCTIPSGATALSLNVVAISPTASSFLTVFPGDATRPTASSLNWVAGQAPTPNSVTASLAADGRLSFYNLAGTVHLAVDVVGHYQPTGAGATGPAGPTGPVGPQGPGADPQGVIWVAKSGGDFTTISAALASITDNSLSNGYVIKVAPGEYVENAGLALKTNVVIEGSGPSTVVVSDGSNANQAAVSAEQQDDTAVRNLKISSTATHAIFADDSTLDLEDVTVEQGAISSNAHGLLSTDSLIDLDRVTFSLSNSAFQAIGLELTGGGTVNVRDTTITVSGSAGSTKHCIAIQADGPSVRVRDGELRASSCSTRNRGLVVGAGQVRYDGGRIVVSGSGASDTMGVDATGGQTAVEDADIRADGPSSHGVYGNGGVVSVERSQVFGQVTSITRVSNFVDAWDSQLDNVTAGMAGSCSDVVTGGSYVPYTCV